jgi:hypothetical protein
MGQLNCWFQHLVAEPYIVALSRHQVKDVSEPPFSILLAMVLYSLRSQRFHRLSLSCAYRRSEGSPQQGHQQNQQDCKVKPQIIRLHPV